MAEGEEGRRPRFVMDRILVSASMLLPHEIPPHLFRIQSMALRLYSYLCIWEVQVFSRTQKNLDVVARASIHSRQRLLYLCGGVDGRKATGATCSLDSVKGCWEPLPDMRRGRAGAAGAVCCSRIFMCGGSDGEETLSSVECYNPGARRWEAGPPMLRPRSGASAVLVEGCVCVVGGKDGATYLNTAERFRPKPLEGVFHGRVGTAQFFNKSIGEKWKWRVTNFCHGIYLDARDYVHRQACLPSKPFILTPTTTISVVTQGGMGHLESIAGMPAVVEGNATSEGFLGLALRDVRSQTWILSNRRTFKGEATRPQEGTGSEETIKFTSKELAPFSGREVTLDIVDTFCGLWGWICVRRVMVSGVEMTGEWEALPPMQEPRCHPAAGKLPATAAGGPGRLVVAGGMESNTKCLSSVERFDPIAEEGAGCWAYEMPMSAPRSSAACAGMGGYLYVCGGIGDNGLELNTVERLCAQTGQWEVMSVMTHPRNFPAVAASAGRLYVFGGIDGGRYLDVVEHFDEEGWRFEQMAVNLPERRACCIAVAMESVPRIT